MSSKLETISNLILEQLGLGPNREPGSFYDLHIKPYEVDTGSNVNPDGYQTPEDVKDYDYLNSVKPKPFDDQLVKDPISGTYDYSSIQPDLVEELVKTFEGYKYEVKRDGDTIIVTFKQQIGADLVKKWADLFPDNKFKGIGINIEVNA